MFSFDCGISLSMASQTSLLLVKQVGAAVFYGAASLLIIMVNKAVLTSYGWVLYHRFSREYTVVWYLKYLAGLGTAQVLNTLLGQWTGICTISTTVHILLGTPIIQFSNTNTRSHPLSICIPSTTINPYRHSFFFNTPFVWNSIPHCILQSNRPAFHCILSFSCCIIQVFCYFCMFMSIVSCHCKYVSNFCG